MTPDRGSPSGPSERPTCTDYDRGAEWMRAQIIAECETRAVLHDAVEGEDDTATDGHTGFIGTAAEHRRVECKELAHALRVLSSPVEERDKLVARLADAERERATGRAALDFIAPTADHANPRSMHEVAEAAIAEYKRLVEEVSALRDDWHAADLAVEQAERERDEARASNKELHRRCQQAESIADKAIPGRPQGEHGRSFGRALANYAAARAEQRCAALERRCAELGAALRAAWTLVKNLDYQTGPAEGYEARLLAVRVALSDTYADRLLGGPQGESQRQGRENRTEDRTEVGK